MSDKEFYCQFITSFNGFEDIVGQHRQREALKSLLLPEFEKKVFSRTAGAYYEHGNAGLKAQFGKVSMLVDGFGGRMLVTLRHVSNNTMVTFGSHTEEPFGLFHNPTVISYYGSPKDMALMVDQAAQGIKRGRREGRQVFRESPVLAKMFGG